MKTHSRSTKLRQQNGVSNSRLLASNNGMSGTILLDQKRLNFTDSGCSRSMVLECFGSSLKTCTVNLGCTLSFWQDIAMEKEIHNHVVSIELYLVII